MREVRGEGMDSMKCLGVIQEMCRECYSSWMDGRMDGDRAGGERW
jgi:hypothetical protein